MNVSRARFTHSRQNDTLAESRSEEGSLTGSSAQPATWRIPHSSPSFQPGTHTDRAIAARHGSSEGHEMLKRNDKYHSIADDVPIPKM